MIHTGIHRIHSRITVNPPVDLRQSSGTQTTLPPDSVYSGKGFRGDCHLRENVLVSAEWNKEVLIACCYKRKNMNYDVLQSGGQNTSCHKTSIFASSATSAFSVVIRQEDCIFASSASSGHVCSCEKELVVFSLLLKLLEDIPPEPFSRTWATSRTFMVRRSSKTLKKLVDPLCFN